MSFDYGILNQRNARRCKLKGNVQFVLWRKGDQKYVDGIGHTHDVWVDFDSSWWNDFIPNFKFKSK